MNFIIKPFSIYQSASNYFCYSHQTSAKITNENLINLLQDILQKNIHEFSKQEFESLAANHQLKSEAVLPFLLEELRIISLKNESRFQHLYIMSDNKKIQDALCQEFSRHYGLTVTPKMDFSPITTEKSMILIFNQEYKEQEFKKIYELSDQSDSYFVTSFLADKYLIIDNVYNKNKGMPCHFCGINQLRTTTLSSSDINQFSWLIFYRKLLKSGFSSFPVVPLTMLSESLVIYTLGRFIKQFADPFNYELYQEHVNEFWHTDLVKNKIEREAAMHWNMCDCVHD